MITRLCYYRLVLAYLALSNEHFSEVIEMGNLRLYTITQSATIGLIGLIGLIGFYLLFRAQNFRWIFPIGFYLFATALRSYSLFR